jgi:hypothetical protein
MKLKLIIGILLFSLSLQAAEETQGKHSPIATRHKRNRSLFPWKSSEDIRELEKALEKLPVRRPGSPPIEFKAFSEPSSPGNISQAVGLFGLCMQVDTSSDKIFISPCDLAPELNNASLGDATGNSNYDTLQKNKGFLVQHFEVIFKACIFQIIRKDLFNFPTDSKSKIDKEGLKKVELYVDKYPFLEPIRPFCESMKNKEIDSKGVHDKQKEFLEYYIKPAYLALQAAGLNLKAE